jgi:drug/metabolite transporter (DMT)-like permease
MNLLADLVVVVHALFIAFVVLGGLLVMRWPRLAWVHLPGAAWGTGYTDGFIAHYLLPVIYPPGLTPGVRYTLAGLVIAVNAAVYGRLLWRRRAAPPPLWAVTTFALVAFAMNSILCRLALGTGAIDATAFTAVRLASGAIMLLALTAATRRGAAARAHRDPLAAAMLFAYAFAFSLAYRDLAASTGALILFATVQVTMIGWGLHRGERLTVVGWAGFLLAVAGLVALMSPGLRAPSPGGAALMVLAGIAWGAYSLRGRGAADPLAATTTNFTLATLPALAILALPAACRTITTPGVLLAIASGALASALGYVAWYAALPRFSATGSAAIQLLVPVLAAVAGLGLLQESLDFRLAIAAAMILGGVWLTLRRAARAPRAGRP